MFIACELMTISIKVYFKEGSQRLFVMRVETIEFYIFNITQIVYVIVTFKLIIFLAFLGRT